STHQTACIDEVCCSETRSCDQPPRGGRRRWLAITRNVDGLKGVLGMKEQALRHLIATVKNGKLSRRAFVQRMVALGLTAPMASQMLDYWGVGRAQSAFHHQSTKAGGRGTVDIIYCQ